MKLHDIGAFVKILLQVLVKTIELIAKKYAKINSNNQQ